MTTPRYPRWLEEVPCPTCKAEKETPCIDPTTKSTLSPKVHAARVAAHAKSVERYAFTFKGRTWVSYRTSQESAIAFFAKTLQIDPKLVTPLTIGPHPKKTDQPPGVHPDSVVP